jgi:opacity protein-like surface antigen
VFSVPSLMRRTAICVTACAIIAGALAAPAGAADVRDRARDAALARGEYLTTYGTDPKPIGDSGVVDGAQAQARYYASYRDARPLSLERRSEPDDGTSWSSLLLGAAFAGGIMLFAAGLESRRRRQRRVTAVA